MSVQLDRSSREAIGRFVVKFCVSVLLASWAVLENTIGIAGWLGLFAVLTAAYALMRGERFPQKNFNHWDESLWLLAACLVFRLLDKALG